MDDLQFRRVQHSDEVPILSIEGCVEESWSDSNDSEHRTTNSQQEIIVRDGSVPAKRAHVYVMDAYSRSGMDVVPRTRPAVPIRLDDLSL